MAWYIVNSIPLLYWKTSIYKVLFYITHMMLLSFIMNCKEACFHLRLQTSEVKILVALLPMWLCTWICIDVLFLATASDQLTYYWKITIHFTLVILPQFQQQSFMKTTYMYNHYISPKILSLRKRSYFYTLYMVKKLIFPSYKWVKKYAFI